MKKLIIAVILILASLLIAPKIIGSVVQQEREKSVAELNNTDGFTLTTKDYTSGWFGADVSSELTISLEDTELKEVTLLVEEVLSFGPVLMTEQGLNTGLGYSTLSVKLLSTVVDEEIMQLINEKIHLGALLGFNKNITTFITTDKLSYERDGSRIVSSPAAAQFTFIDNKHISGNLAWGGLELDDLGERLVIGKVAMSTEQNVVSGDYLKGTAILTGDALFHVDNLDLFDQDVHVFSLSGAEVSSVVSLEDDLLSLNLKKHAKDISVSGQDFVEPNIDITLANIDINALQKLNTTMADLSSTSPQQDNAEQILKVLSEVADKILAKKPMLKVNDLSVTTEEGKVATELNLKINKDLFDTTNLNSMSLMMALEGDATGKLPVDLLAKFGVAPMADNFVNQGYLTKKDGEISFVAKYSQSKLTLNGKDFQF